MRRYLHFCKSVQSSMAEVSVQFLSILNTCHRPMSVSLCFFDFLSCFLWLACISGSVIMEWLRLRDDNFSLLGKGFDCLSDNEVGEENKDVWLLKILNCFCKISSLLFRSNLSSDFLSVWSSLVSFFSVAASIAFRVSKFLALFFDSTNGSSLFNFIFLGARSQINVYSVFTQNQLRKYVFFGWSKWVLWYFLNAQCLL